MAYPVLAPNSTWFAPTNSSVTRSMITEIEIMDSYTPDSSVTVVNSWDASAAKDGNITCYVIGTKLIIAGNGSGKIAANEDSSNCFATPYVAGVTMDLFSSVTTLTGLNLLDMSNVTTMRNMFYNCSSIISINASNWDVGSCTDMFAVFYGCSSMASIDVSTWNVSNVTTMSRMFQSCSSITSINVSNWDVSNVTDMSMMFIICSRLKEIDVSNWDVSNVTDMSSMFAECKALVDIDVSNWNVSNVTNMNHMFDTAALTYLDVSKWNVSSCTKMAFMFYHCSSLGEIDVSNWDVSSLTDLDHFAAHANLKRRGMEKWNTSSIVNANAAFHNCAEEELDLSGWDVSNVQFFCQMFENSPNLKRIKGLEKWNTSAGLGFDGMFERCYVLEEVDLSSFDTSKAKNGTKASGNGHKTGTLQNMFLSCNNLKKVTVGPNFSINGNGSNTTAGNKAILPTPSTDYIEGADGNWYTFTGDAHAPNAMKDKTAETYYASYNIVADADVIVKNGSLIDTAKAIREKNGSTDKYTPAQFGAAIRALS